MKKLLCLLLALCLCVGVCACAKGPIATNLNTSSDLSSIMDFLLEGSELPGSAMSFAPPADEAIYYAFTQLPAGSEVLVNEAQMSPVAHSLVLVRLPQDVDANKVAEAMDENADPRKWICVEAEETEVLQKGQLVLLIMTNDALAENVEERFEALGR